MGISSLPPGEPKSEPQSAASTTLIQRLSGTLAPLSFLLLLGLVLAWRVPHFAERGNLKNIAIQSAVIAILACGQTAVIISGNIDLSVGAVMAFAGVAAAEAMAHHGVGVWPAVLLAITAGLAMGTITGLITAFGKIPSFIVTLGMMGVVYGASGILSGSKNIGGLAPGFEMFGNGELFGSRGKRRHSLCRADYGECRGCNEYSADAITLGPDAVRDGRQSGSHPLVRHFAEQGRYFGFRPVRPAGGDRLRRQHFAHGQRAV